MTEESLFEAFKDATSFYGREDLWLKHSDGDLVITLLSEGAARVSIREGSEVRSLSIQAVTAPVVNDRLYSAGWEHEDSRRDYFTLQSVFAKEVCR